MTERPILFNDVNVRRILEGKKTQTRRVVKWKGVEEGLNLGFSGLHAGHYVTRVPSTGWVLRSRDGSGAWNDRTAPTRCPYGRPGDCLWVREAWQFLGTDMNRLGRTGRFQDGVVRYPADNAKRTITTHWENVEKYMTVKRAQDVKRVRPSIHMPRWVSRITPKVRAVRVERLQEISTDDIRREGLTCPTHDFHSGFCTSPCPDLLAAWAKSWDGINASRGYGWDTNPWVWVVEFERVAQEVAA